MSSPSRFSTDAIDEFDNPALLEQGLEVVAFGELLALARSVRSKNALHGYAGDIQGEPVVLSLV